MFSVRSQSALVHRRAENRNPESLDRYRDQASTFNSSNCFESFSAAAPLSRVAIAHLLRLSRHRQHGADLARLDVARRVSTSSRDQRLFKKKRCSIRNGQIVWDAVKVSVKFFLLYSDGFEEKRFASHVHGHLRYFPMTSRDLGPFHRELPALFEMPELPSCELNFVHELPIDADQALLLGVNPYLACHFVKDLSLTGRRPEGRIRLEG